MGYRVGYMAAARTGLIFKGTLGLLESQTWVQGSVAAWDLLCASWLGGLGSSLGAPGGQPIGRVEFSACRLAGITLFLGRFGYSAPFCSCLQSVHVARTHPWRVPPPLHVTCLLSSRGAALNQVACDHVLCGEQPCDAHRGTSSRICAGPACLQAGHTGTIALVTGWFWLSYGSLLHRTSHWREHPRCAALRASRAP